MDFQKLKTFRTVATLMNFNQAAKVLHYAQSSVSAQIKALENDLGAQLFERVGKKINLTPAGEKMLQYAHKMLAIEQEARDELNSNPRGASLLTLRMPQTVATYHLPRVLPVFQEQFPEVDLDITSCALFSLENELSIGTVDLAFLLTDTVSAASLDIEMLRTEPLVMVASPGHPLAAQARLDMQDLEGQVLFLPKADCGYRMAFEQALTMDGIRLRSLIEMNSIEAIKESVAKGSGVTIIPRISIEQELQRGRLVILDWKESLETGVLMIWHKGKWFSPALETFMEAFRQSLATA
ncbi:MAG: LysR family transcriptional regulator [Desulfatibacillum sp.]|nr:LysR family transcriptional regulator [Desulfatibacillum sp.]